MLSSSVVPVSTQMVAPFSSLACATLSAFFTMKASPVKKLLAPGRQPELGVASERQRGVPDETSISPDCSTEKSGLSGKVGADELHLVGAAEHGGCQGAGNRKCRALPIYRRKILEREAGNSGIDTTDQTRRAS